MEVVFLILISLAWNVIKGLFLILATYYVYSFIMDAIESVWEITHPKSLEWVKGRFSRKKERLNSEECNKRD